MTPGTTASLSEAALNIANQGAREYLKTHRLKAEPYVLLQCLLDSVKGALAEALRDASEAFEAGMVDIGMQTFAASMVLAGIEAAKNATKQQKKETNES